MISLSLVALVLLFVGVFAHIHPDAQRSFTEIITAAGYQVNRHEVIVEDGHILTLFHIPASESTKHSLFVHGLAVNVASWFFGGSNSSVSTPIHVLENTDSNVWFLALRGTSYSYKHVNLSSSDPQFWDWSMDEMIKYDLPTVVQYIFNTKHVSKFSLIGHSQGGAIILGSLSTHQWLNSLVDSAIVMAPAVYLHHIDVTLFKVLSKLNSRSIEFFLGNRNFLATPELMNKLVPGFCDRLDSVCRFTICLYIGCDGLGHIDKERLPVVVSHAPDETSVKNMIHFSQLVKNSLGKFQYFDYGNTELNLLHYGSSTPPMYDLTKVTTPIYLWSYGKDKLVSRHDMAFLSMDLQYSEWNMVNQYGHGDCLFGNDVEELMLVDIVRQLRREGF
ncbi:hypothetical protein P9112_007806 [Eukaryota sp. TZLM1-RC]